MTEISAAWQRAVDACGIAYSGPSRHGYISVAPDDWYRLHVAWVKVWGHVKYESVARSVFAPSVLRLVKKAFDDPKAVFASAELVELAMDLEP